MPDLRAAGMKDSRAWQDLSWSRLILGAAIAPVPALYIGFAAFFLSYSDRNLTAVFRFMFPKPSLYACGFAFIFVLLYLNLISRFRGRVGLIECIFAGGIGAFLLVELFFVAVEFDIMGPLPYMTFFPGFVLRADGHLLLAGALLGLIVAPAGALSGWIFWRIGVAPAKTPE